MTEGGVVSMVVGGRRWSGDMVVFSSKADDRIRSVVVHRGTMVKCHGRHEAMGHLGWRSVLCTDGRVL